MRKHTTNSTHTPSQATSNDSSIPRAEVKPVGVCDSGVVLRVNALLRLVNVQLMRPLNLSSLQYELLRAFWRALPGILGRLGVVVCGLLHWLACSADISAKVPLFRSLLKSWSVVCSIDLVSRWSFSRYSNPAVVRSFFLLPYFLFAVLSKTLAGWARSGWWHYYNGRIISFSRSSCMPAVVVQY